VPSFHMRVVGQIENGFAEFPSRYIGSNFWWPVRQHIPHQWAWLLYTTTASKDCGGKAVPQWSWCPWKSAHYWNEIGNSMPTNVWRTQIFDDSGCFRDWKEA
jgi:hypothetical protein